MSTELIGDQQMVCYGSHFIIRSNF